MNPTEMPLQTPLHAVHQQLGARLVDFAGWSMPIQYTSIMSEHRATRQHVGLFDVSHMGRLRIQGRDAAAWLDAVLTRRVDNLPPGRIRYSLVTQDDGGILDDVLVYRMPEPHDGYLLVVNASNRQAILSWLQQHRPPGSDAQCQDTTCQTGMIAVQGPAALELVPQILGYDPSPLRYYTHALIDWRSAEVLVSRTGYTGEYGVELIVPADLATELWGLLSSTPVAGGLASPVGLGARDTLRLEGAMPLYGHELGTWCDPWEAGLAFAVDLGARRFPGSDLLRTRQENPPARQRIGLKLAGRRAARQHCPILAAGKSIGEVTSGTFSPTLEEPIAMGYVPPEWTIAGTELEVDVRGSVVPAQVVPLPFYRREK